MKYFCLWLLFIFSSCVVQDIIDPPSLKESYFNNLSDQNKEKWLSLAQISGSDRIAIDFPYRELLSLDTANAVSAGYIINCNRGVKLHIDIESDSVFVEVYQFSNDSTYEHELVYETITLQSKHEVEIKEDGKYFIRIQPQLGLSSEILLSIYTSPVYIFPVAGGKFADIGSFWGDSRDGGKRKHKGVDIFAKKGTALLAVSNGKIRSSRNSGLGGKQIWLLDRERDQSVYYAHLDSQYVSRGDRVVRGDTIGTVGNTGNARTTPPHLHFGIYRFQKGAIDPLNHILNKKMKFKVPNAPKLIAGSIAEVKVSNANFRIKPDPKSEIIRKLRRGNLLRVIGVSGNWYHLRTSDGIAGFLYKSSISFLPEPT